jgi:hypothetical protein
MILKEKVVEDVKWINLAQERKQFEAFVKF